MKYNDWRLPTRQELESLLDLTRHDPAIDTDFFPDTQASIYWSSDPHANYPSGVWIVDFGSGYVYSFNKSFHEFVRAVRTCSKDEILDQRLSSVTNNRFRVIDDVVIDMESGLMWQQKTIGPYSWDEARRAIGEMNHDNQT